MNQHNSHTSAAWGGNEISCLVAGAVLDVASLESFLSHVRTISEAFRRYAERRFAASTTICCRRGVVHGGNSREGQRSRQRDASYKAMYDHGVLCHSDSVIEPTVLKFLPPLILSEDQAKALPVHWRVRQGCAVALPRPVN